MTPSSVPRASILGSEPPQRSGALCADRMLARKRRSRTRLRRPSNLPMFRRTQRRPGFMIATTRLRCAALALVMGLLAAGAICATPRAEPQAGGTALASHLAIYDLKLANSRGKRSLEAVRGRIVYDFSSACEGYGLQFRQVTSLDSGEGKTALSDLRATSWEDAEAKSFRFTSQNFLDDRMVENVDGNAERQPDGVTVKLSKPEQKQFNAGGAVFPTEHM